jgi:hypothetical protein
VFLLHTCLDDVCVAFEYMIGGSIKYVEKGKLLMSIQDIRNAMRDVISGLGYRALFTVYSRHLLICDMGSSFFGNYPPRYQT